jgi:membrane protein required for colicin V production
MATLDLVLIGLLLVSLILGWWRGLVFELLSLAAWAGAFFVARSFAPAVVSLLATPLSALLPSPALQQAVAFALIFIATVFVGNLLAVVLKKILATMGLSSADRGLGALFGLARGLVGVLALAWVVLTAGLQSSAWVMQSKGMGYATAVLQSFGKFKV